MVFFIQGFFIAVFMEVGMESRSINSDKRDIVKHEKSKIIPVEGVNDDSFGKLLVEITNKEKKRLEVIKKKQEEEAVKRRFILD